MIDWLVTLTTLPADALKAIGTVAVGGLLAMTLGRVPIPGATVEVGGLNLVAESAKGRRNQIGTVLVRRTEEEST